jgi:putative transposase
LHEHVLFGLPYRYQYAPNTQHPGFNAVAESFFQLLKRERIKRHIYSTRNDARSDIVDYIEIFYNSKRRHSFNNQLSPVQYEKQFKKRLASV